MTGITAYAIAFVIAVIGGMINGIAGGGTVLVFPMLVWTRDDAGPRDTSLPADLTR